MTTMATAVLTAVMLLGSITAVTQRLESADGARGVVETALGVEIDADGRMRDCALAGLDATTPAGRYLHLPGPGCGR